MGARRRRGLRGRRGVRALATEEKANGRAGELVVPLEAVGVGAVWLRCSATVTPCRSPENGDVRRPAWGFADRVDRPSRWRLAVSRVQLARRDRGGSVWRLTR